MVCIEQVLKSTPYHTNTFRVSFLYGMYSDGVKRAWEAHRLLATISQPKPASYD